MSKNLIPKVVGVLAAIVYIAYLYFCFARVPFDADMANTVLEANDMLHGNIFLSGWCLTGITFLTTSLPYFLLAVLFCGLSQVSFILAMTLMFFTAIIGSLILLRAPKDTTPLSYVALFLALSAIPSAYWCSDCVVHIGYVGLGMLALFFAVKARDTEEGGQQRRWLIGAGASFALLCAGDTVSVLTIIGPIMLVASIDLLRQYWKIRTDWQKSELATASASAAPSLRDKMQSLKSSAIKLWQEIPRSNVYLLFTGLASLAVGELIDKGYVLLGGLNRNTYVGGRTFNPITQFITNLTNYLRHLFLMSGGDIEGYSIGSLSSIFALIHIAAVLIGLGLVVYNVAQYLRGKKIDYIGVVLSLGILFVSFVCICTSLSAARYYVHVPMALNLIIVRWLVTEHRAVTSELPARVVTWIAALAIFSASLYPPVPLRVTINSTHDRLLKTLKDNGLTSGYAEFWYASPITVLSNNKVRVRAIRGGASNLAQRAWFSKNDWYKEYANFVILSPDEYDYVTKRNVRGSLGKPDRIIEVNSCKNFVWDHKYEDLKPEALPRANFTIFVYDHDISKELVSSDWWQIKNGSNIFKLSESLFLSNTRQFRKRPYVSAGKGCFVWGPYVHMAPGRYTAVFNYSCNFIPDPGEVVGTCDVQSISGGFVNKDYQKDMPSSKNSAKIKFTVERDCHDFELRVHARREGVIVDSVEIIKH